MHRCCQTPYQIIIRAEWTHERRCRWAMRRRHTTTHTHKTDTWRESETQTHKSSQTNWLCDSWCYVYVASVQVVSITCLLANGHASDGLAHVASSYPLAQRILCIRLFVQSHLRGNHRSGRVVFFDCRSCRRVFNIIFFHSFEQQKVFDNFFFLHFTQKIERKKYIVPSGTWDYKIN